MEKGAWRGYADFALAAFRRFYEERGLQTAGSLTYTTLLSLVPLFTVALAVSTAFPVFDEAMTALQQFVLENFLPAQTVDQLFEQTAQQQYTRELLFSSCVDLMALVVARTYGSVKAAYLKRQEQLGVTLKCVYESQLLPDRPAPRRGPAPGVLGSAAS